jgi:multidrug efflux system outer membrane protein
MVPGSSTRSKYALGVDLRFELAVAEASVYRFQRQIVQSGNARRILLGRNPRPVRRGLALDEQVLPVSIPG